MFFHTVSISDPGLAQPENQDCVFAVEALGLFGVADGLSSSGASGLAAFIASEVVRHTYTTRAPAASGTATMLKAFHVANGVILEEIAANPPLFGMATTLTVLALEKEKVYLGHCGDSRAYRLRGMEWECLTQDHVTHTAGNTRTLTHALGVYENPEFEVSEFALLEGDRFFLCSDGITDEVSDAEILTLLTRWPSTEAAHRLLTLAKAKGGKDNLSFQIIDPINKTW